MRSTQHLDIKVKFIGWVILMIDIFKLIIITGCRVLIDNKLVCTKKQELVKRLRPCIENARFLAHSYAVNMAEILFNIVRVYFFNPCLKCLIRFGVYDVFAALKAQSKYKLSVLRALHEVNVTVLMGTSEYITPSPSVNDIPKRTKFDKVVPCDTNLSNVLGKRVRNIQLEITLALLKSFDDYSRAGKKHPFIKMDNLFKGGFVPAIS